MGRAPRWFRLTDEVVKLFWVWLERGEPDACWLWRGSKNPAGYGQLQLCEGGDRLSVLAHRVSWMIANRAAPGDKLVLQRCDVPACCNPAHLWLGDDQANSDDMRAKGRQNYGGMVGRRGDQHPRTKYGATVRERAIEAARGGTTYSAIAREIGCDRVSVMRWVEAADLAEGKRLEPSVTYLRARPAGV